MSKKFNVILIGEPPHSVQFWIGNQGFMLHDYSRGEKVEGEDPPEHLNYSKSMLELALSKLEDGTALDVIDYRDLSDD